MRKRKRVKCGRCKQWIPIYIPKHICSPKPRRKRSAQSETKSPISSNLPVSGFPGEWLKFPNHIE